MIATGSRIVFTFVPEPVAAIRRSPFGIESASKGFAKIECPACSVTTVRHFTFSDVCTLFLCGCDKGIKRGIRYDFLCFHFHPLSSSKFESNHANSVRTLPTRNFLDNPSTVDSTILLKICALTSRRVSRSVAKYETVHSL